MAAPLRVDPEALRSAAAAQSDVAAQLCGLPGAAAITGVAGSMAGLATAAAGAEAGATIDRVSAAVAGALTTHADRLRRAAELYTRTDEDLARWCARCL